MLRRKPHTHTTARDRGPGREGLVAMLRRPAVQLLLGVVAVGQVVSATQQEREPGVVALPAVEAVAPNGASVGEAWRARAIERESARLAEKFREQGYPLTRDLATKIYAAAVEYEIEPEIAFGLVRAESSFRNTATSVVGAVGLTQLMPSTARWLEPGITRRELRDPDTNLRIGFRYLRELIEKYDGNTDLALIAYNRGPGTVDRALKRGRNPDNGYAAYVRGKKNHGHRLFTR